MGLFWRLVLAALVSLAVAPRARVLTQVPARMLVTAVMRTSRER